MDVDDSLAPVDFLRLKGLHRAIGDVWSGVSFFGACSDLRNELHELNAVV